MRSGRILLGAVWLAAASLVVLSARALAYALAPPTVLQPRLEHAAGGPGLVLVALVALGVCGALAIAIVWLAATAVRERASLAVDRPEPPRLRALRVAAHSLGLALVTCTGFAALESYLHLRAGLGWHGLHCLTGPVHANAVPILCALSVLAAAAIDAGRHVLAWMRRTIRLLLDRVPRADAPAITLAPRASRSFARVVVAGAGPRAPPVAA